MSTGGGDYVLIVVAHGDGGLGRRMWTERFMTIDGAERAKQWIEQQSADISAGIIMDITTYPPDPRL